MSENKLNPQINLELSAYDVMTIVNALKYQARDFVRDYNSNPDAILSDISKNIHDENKALGERLESIVREKCPWVD